MRPFLKLLSLIFFITSSFLHSKEVIQFTGYPALCTKALEDPAVFETFRNASGFSEAMGVGEGIARGYLDQVHQRYPQYLSLMKNCRVNDQVGSPNFIDCKADGTFSPETLKYFKIASDLKAYFGDLGGLHIVEIGGGFGGQCCVLNALGGFASYTIVDLPECNALTQAYLERLGIENVTFVDIGSLTQPLPCDVVVSNYRFSQMDLPTQQNASISLWQLLRMAI